MTDPVHVRSLCDLITHTETDTSRPNYILSLNEPGQYDVNLNINLNIQLPDPIDPIDPVDPVNPVDPAGSFPAMVLPIDTHDKQHYQAATVDNHGQLIAAGISSYSKGPLLARFNAEFSQAEQLRAGDATSAAFTTLCCSDSGHIYAAGNQHPSHGYIACFDDQLNLLQQIRLSKMGSNPSAILYHGGYIYLLGSSSPGIYLLKLTPELNLVDSFTLRPVDYDDRMLSAAMTLSPDNKLYISAIVAGTKLYLARLDTELTLEREELFDKITRLDAFAFSNNGTLYCLGHSHAAPNGFIGQLDSELTQLAQYPINSTSTVTQYFSQMVISADGEFWLTGKQVSSSSTEPAALIAQCDADRVVQQSWMLRNHSADDIRLQATTISANQPYWVGDLSNPWRAVAINPRLLTDAPERWQIQDAPGISIGTEALLSKTTTFNKAPAWPLPFSLEPGDKVFERTDISQG